MPGRESTDGEVIDRVTARSWLKASKELENLSFHPYMLMVIKGYKL